MSQEQDTSPSSPGLVKGLLLLEQVAQAQHPLAFGELQQRSATAKSTLIRLLRVLQNEGWLQKEQQAYVPGPRLLALGQVADPLEQLRKAAEPELATLAEQSGNSTACFAIDGNENELLNKAMHPAAPSMREIGSRQQADPLSPWGWIMMQEASEEEREKFLAKAELSPKELQAWKQAEEDLEQRGWCLDDQIGIPLVCRMAVPLRQPGTNEIRGVLALGGNPLTMPESRREELGHMLLAAAERIQGAFGVQVG